ncbi:hypothetical protein HQ39_09045 [Porphyromonas sp. COT-108 OH2963]|nr:hypothetical protein HQ39_09045 [Porphyromonas sp. COT-108 OH2963]
MIEEDKTLTIYKELFLKKINKNNMTFMHKTRLLLLLILGTLVVTACRKDPLRPNEKKDPEVEQPEKPKENDPPAQTDLFPKPDGSRILTGSPAERVFALLSNMTFDEPLPLGETRITEAQLNEIKAFADKLVAEKQPKNQREMHDLLFGWIRKNVKYGNTFDPSIPDYNSAYTTFKHKVAICQGYSNLLKVFCHTQKISAPIVNGLARFNTLGNPLGHAWNYVLLDGKWFVSDATNGIFYDANDPKRFDFLLPERLDFPLFRDEKFVCTYEKRELTISSVQDSFTGEKLVVPYGVGGFQIGSFNPTHLPKSVKEIYLGRNIKMLGTSDQLNLKESGKNVEKILVDPENPHLEEYKGTIYIKGDKSNLPFFIPDRLKVVKMKPMKSVGKNVIFGHEGMEELYFEEGTETIEDYAVEACPNLRKVYLPKSVKSVADRAFFRCHSELKVVRL